MTKPLHVTRMEAERDALQEKIDKLVLFFDTALFGGLLELDRNLMFAQYDAMVKYVTILSIRLSRV